MSEHFSASKTDILQNSEILERFAAHPFSTLETYQYFNQKGEAAKLVKADFIAKALQGNSPEAPDFSYESIDLDDLLIKRDELTAILEEVSLLDMTNEENTLARENITNRIHEVGILILTKLQSQTEVGSEQYANISYQLGENMREVYGVPEVNHWRGILGYRLSLLKEVEHRSDVPDQIISAWRRISDEFPKDLPIEKPYQPRPETLAWYKDRLDERLTPAREAVTRAIENGEVGLSDEGKLDAHNIVIATRIALIAGGATGWGAKITTASNIDTSQTDMMVNVPETSEMTLSQFDSVINSHEIDEHVIRRVNGDSSGVAVLGGTGCNGYLDWEEGNGRANEGLIKGEIINQNSAFLYFLHGGLALGLDGDRTGRTFGATFDLVCLMNLIDSFLEGKITADNIETEQRKVMESTYNSLMRIYRGTDGKTPGVIFTKDVLSYYLGQVKVFRKWDNDMKLSEEKRLEEHNLERRAKIDPTRPDHRRVASKYLHATPIR
ncbi:MAG TPA: hypothetical protein VGA08_02910 [Candidatus Saccharimonadales bacterium]